MNPSLSICECILVGTAWLLFWQPMIQGQETDSPGAPVPQTGILLMHSLEVIPGPYVREGAVYLIPSPEGEVVIASDNVMFECANIEEAYLKLKPRVVAGNPGDHVAMARWCARNGLKDDAHEHLQEAVKLNPENQEYQFLLQRLEDQMNPYLPAMKKQDGENRDRFDLSAGMLEKVEPLGGLTRFQAREFASKIQPILLNSCTTSGCHTKKSDQKFILRRMNDGFPAGKTTQRNLDMVLEFVNKQNPEQSLLLTAHQNATGDVKDALEKIQARDWEASLWRWISRLDDPEVEMPIPEESGTPKNANAVATITRDWNRHEKRRRVIASRKKTVIRPAPIAPELPTRDFLEELLTDEVASEID